MKFYPAFFLALSCATAVPDQATELGDWRIVKVEKFTETIEQIGAVARSVVTFGNGRRLMIPLFRARPITVLQAVDGTWFMLAEGADCVDCEERVTLRFFVLGSDDLRASKKRYSYPGIYKDYITAQVLEKTRTFYGQCLEERGDVVVWLQEFFDEDATWRNSDFVAVLSKEGAKLVVLDRAKMSLSFIEERIADGSCKELPGIEGTVEP